MKWRLSFGMLFLLLCHCQSASKPSAKCENYKHAFSPALHKAGNAIACRTTSKGGERGLCTQGLRFCEVDRGHYKWSKCVGRVTPKGPKDCYRGVDSTCNGKLDRRCPHCLPVSPRKEWTSSALSFQSGDLAIMSPSGKKLLWVQSRRVKVVTYPEGKVLFEKKGRFRTFFLRGHLSWSPDSQFVTITSPNDREHVVLYRSSDGKPLQTYTVKPSSVLKMFTYAGKQLVLFELTKFSSRRGGMSAKITLYDALKGRVLRSFGVMEPMSTYYLPYTKGFVKSVAISPKGRYLVLHGYSVRKRKMVATLWALLRGQKIGVLYEHHSKPSVMSFSPDEKYLIAGNVQGQMNLWSLPSRKRLDDWKEESPITSIAWSADSKWAAIGFYNGQVKLWNLTKKRWYSSSKQDGYRGDRKYKDLRTKRWLRDIHLVSFGSAYPNVVFSIFDHSLRTFRRRDLRLLKRSSHTIGDIRASLLSLDGRRLYLADGGRLSVWSFHKKQLLYARWDDVSKIARLSWVRHKQTNTLKLLVRHAGFRGRDWYTLWDPALRGFQKIPEGMLSSYRVIAFQGAKPINKSDIRLRRDNHRTRHRQHFSIEYTHSRSSLPVAKHPTSPLVAQVVLVDKKRFEIELWDTKSKELLTILEGESLRHYYDRAKQRQLFFHPDGMSLIYIRKRVHIWTCGCLAGEKRACYTGKVSWLSRGVCRKGTQRCVSGQWGACEGQRLPGVERPNNKDDDCDGLVD